MRTAPTAVKNNNLEQNVDEFIEPIESFELMQIPNQQPSKLQLKKARNDKEEDEVYEIE